MATELLDYDGEERQDRVSASKSSPVQQAQEVSPVQDAVRPVDNVSTEFLRDIRKFRSEAEQLRREKSHLQRRISDLERDLSKARADNINLHAQLSQANIAFKAFRDGLEHQRGPPPERRFWEQPPPPPRDHYRYSPY